VGGKLDRFPPIPVPEQEHRRVALLSQLEARQCQKLPHDHREPAGPRILLDPAEGSTFGPWREPFSSFMALANLADGEARCTGSRYSELPWDQAIE
jgi:hypothetical protein